MGSYAGDAFVFSSGARVVAWACFWVTVLGVVGAVVTDFGCGVGAFGGGGLGGTGRASRTNQVRSAAVRALIRRKGRPPPWTLVMIVQKIWPFQSINTVVKSILRDA